MTALADPARNRRIGLLFAGLALGFLCLAFAAVPFYRAFCQVTGLNGTPREAIGAAAPGAVGGARMSVRFDGNVNGLPWRFEPEAQTEPVTVGARDIAFFRASNTSSRSVTGRAVFNVTPAQAGRYFVKIQCFCFTEQTLAPEQSVRMPVIFYVDPAILKDPDARGISEITLSYTFYPVDRLGRQS